MQAQNSGSRLSSATSRLLIRSQNPDAVKDGGGLSNQKIIESPKCYTRSQSLETLPCYDAEQKNENQAGIDTDKEKGEPGEPISEKKELLFEYKGRKHRLAVVSKIRRHLVECPIAVVKTPYRWYLRYVLILLLILVAIFLTPSMLPKWLRIKWPAPSDMCQQRDVKLANITATVDHVSNMTRGGQFVHKAGKALDCMESGARDVWNGREKRILFPNDCKPENIKDPTKASTQTCAEAHSTKHCEVGKIDILFIKDIPVTTVCAEVSLPSKCVSLEGEDPKSAREVEKAKAEWEAFENQQSNSKLQGIEEGRFTNETRGDVHPNAERKAAQERSDNLLETMRARIDVASNMYIAYCILAVFFGIPLAISRVPWWKRWQAFAFGLKQPTFIVLILLVMSMGGLYNRMIQDMPNILNKWRNDPCWLDPGFMRNRSDIISYACGNVTNQRAELQEIIANMTRTQKQAELCQVCAVEHKDAFADKDLIVRLANQRELYQSGEEHGYKYPGKCDMAKLTNLTASPPESGVDVGDALLSSGILAMMFLKGIIGSWLLYAFSMAEPMTLHRGMVELYGLQDVDMVHTPYTWKEVRNHSLEPTMEFFTKLFSKNWRLAFSSSRKTILISDHNLRPEEIRNAKVFARDTKVAGFVIWSCLLILEVVILVCSTVSPRKAPEFLVLTPGINGSSFNPTSLNSSSLVDVGNWICNGGILKPK